MTYEEIKEIAKAAATAYIMGAHIQDPKEAVDKFMIAYNYSLSNSLNALKQEKGNPEKAEDVRKKAVDSIFDNFSEFSKHF